MKAREMLVEFYEADDTNVEMGYSSSADSDQINQRELSTTRRPRLTLRHLHNMRLMTQLKRKEEIQRLGKLNRMYGNKSEE